MILTLIFISIFAIGLGPIPYVYPNEVFTIDTRPAALSISIFASWTCNTCKFFFRIRFQRRSFRLPLVVTIFFPILRSTFGGFVFLIFFICCLLALILLWYRVSEQNFHRTRTVIKLRGYCRCLKPNAKNSRKSKHSGNDGSIQFFEEEKHTIIFSCSSFSSHLVEPEIFTRLVLLLSLFFVLLV